MCVPCGLADDEGGEGGSRDMRPLPIAPVLPIKFFVTQVSGKRWRGGREGGEVARRTTT